MRIDLTSIMVNDQDEAEQFYTEILGFQKKVDVPVGEFRWITFVSPEVPDGVQLVLEPNENPVGKAFQQGLHEQAFPRRRSPSMTFQAGVRAAAGARRAVHHTANHAGLGHDGGVR